MKRFLAIVTLVVAALTYTPSTLMQERAFNWVISRHTSARLDDAQADQIIATGMGVLSAVDGADDVATNIEVRRSGSVTTFTQTSGAINSQADFNTVIGLPGRVKVVSEINFCGGTIGAGIIGCAPVPGNSLAVERMDTVELDGILWMHEYGHNKGRGHRNGAYAVMDGTIDPDNRRVSAEEKTAYLNAERSLSPQEVGPPMPQGNVRPLTDSPILSVKQFVRQIYTEGLPYEEARRYTRNDIPVLTSMLAARDDESYWANAAATLGAIGNLEAFAPLTAFITLERGTLSRSGYRARRAAVLGLGYLHNASGSADVLKYLTERAGVEGPAVWARELRWNNPYSLMPVARNQQMALVATLAIGLSGRSEAANALRELKRAAEARQSLKMPEDERNFQTEVNNVLDTAIESQALVTRVGLVEYYKQQRKR